MMGFGVFRAFGGRREAVKGGNCKDNLEYFPYYKQPHYSLR